MLLVVLMSLSLIGIISVQVFWIKQSVEDKEEQFTTTVSEVLHTVSEKIEERERKDYFDRYINIKDSVGKPRSSHLKDIFFIDRDVNSNEIRFYSHGILEEDYNIASTFFDNDDANDTTIIKGYTSKRTETIFKEDFGLDGKGYRLTAKQKLEKIGGLSSVEKAAFEDVFREFAKKVPIHKRVSKQEIELLLDRELENRNLNLDFEYGVYSRGLPTKVKSSGFKFTENSLYKTPVFKDSEGFSNYSLLITQNG